MARPLNRPSPGLADRVRFILARRGLSLAMVSRASRSLIPGQRLCHIPHNFYSALRNPRFSPSLYQLLALSAVSGYRLADWLTVFELSFDDVPRFHASLPALRTAEIDARSYQTGALIPSFYDLEKPDFSAPLVPLSHWLGPDTPRRLHSLPYVAAGGRYRYIKIGSQDALAFPELLPGSIVRVRSHRAGTHEPASTGKAQSRELFLVEYGNGLTCSRLHRSKSKKILLCSGQLPYAPVELEEGSEAAVLGVADLEIRPLGRVDKPVVPSNPARLRTPGPLSRVPWKEHAGEFIRRARRRSGLSFREASERTRLIARKLGDSRYYCAQGSLSDYETRKLPPRHVHKFISICAAYFASAADFLEVSGASLFKIGSLAIPAEALHLPPAGSPSRPSKFMTGMRRRLQELPYFLRNAAPSMFGLPDLSVRDVFWAGGVQGLQDCYFAGALFLIVDRRRKTPRTSLSLPIWAQPAYLLEQRDGTYLCGFCNVQNGTLIVSSCFAGQPKLLRLRNRVDAEIVGRVVGIVRKLR